MPEEDALGTARRRGLAVVTGRYRHDDLPDLDSPAQDAETAKRILGNPAIGNFTSFDTLLDHDVRTLQGEIYDFFLTASHDEFLFVYFSCHGRRDPEGRLYLATIDTEPNRLPPTALAADDIRSWMDACPAEKVVVVLDCCYAGAFGGEPRQRTNRERVILLTAGANELAHEGSMLPTAKAVPSAFASAFFEGIEEGRADRNYDGHITVREAFDFAVGKLRMSGRQQTPQMRAGVAGDIVLCRTPATPGRLSRDVEWLVRNRLSAARLLAVDQLAELLNSGEPAKIITAEAALTELSADDDERVSNAANRLLERQHSTIGHQLLAHSPVLAEPLNDQPWFRSAVFYEVHVRTFFDSNEDGIGDLPGLRQKLDYLRWLGVDCLLLTPIYDSPLRDGGHDISNFEAVHPDLGSKADLTELIEAAHALGIRIVLDLVLNHTSTEHAWFEASRTNPDGPYGDFYVWQDDDDRYTEATVIGAGAARERWTLDRWRRQYYWHRFADHEPDLNFDNKAVQDAMIAVLRTWLDLGVDGFRLLTAPYLFERDGTPSEGLDETHDYLARLRTEIDKNYQDRILMAWADRWPSDAAGYFGAPPDRPECNVVLYTSLMPRVFLSMRQEDHRAVSTVLGQTREIPAECQWGIFLRNGDEMSLDLVTAEEREYLKREFAPLARMRNDHGIRRRLAPLHDGRPEQLGLCVALLLSLPGAPVLYYGDEIGMGENLSLPGTAAIRTPMQWSADRSGGFSAAEPEQLALPVVLGSTYGYQSTNVDAQLRRPTSVLRTTKRLIEIRRHSDALSVGSFAEIRSGNVAVWAYVRSYQSEQILCVVNFSNYPQAAELHLAEYAGKWPVEITGGARFPVIGAGTYQVSLAGSGFYWLRLVRHKDAV